MYCRLALETDSPEHWLFCELYDAVRIPQVTSVEGIVTIEFLLNVQEFPTRITRPWRYSHSKNNFMFSASFSSHKRPGYQGMVLLVSIVLVCDTPIQGQEKEKTDTLSPKVSLRWKFLPDQLFLGKIASGIRTLDNYPQHTPMYRTSNGVFSRSMRTARIPEGILKEVCESNVACKILQKRAQLLETLSETVKKDRP